MLSLCNDRQYCPDQHGVEIVIVKPILSRLKRHLTNSKHLFCFQIDAYFFNKISNGSSCCWVVFVPFCCTLHVFNCLLHSFSLIGKVPFLGFLFLRLASCFACTFQVVRVNYCR